MQLVGATPGFIRRPFVVNNLLSGLIAAGLACAILWCTIELAIRPQMPDAGNYISVTEMLAISLGLIAMGALVCVVSAVIATNRYLRKSYDELFLA